MNVVITESDTIDTLYQKARAREREFLDCHYRETGLVWPGRVRICFNLPINFKHKFYRMLFDSGLHIRDAYGNDQLFGLPVFIVGPCDGNGGGK